MSIAEWAERYRVLRKPAEEEGPMRLRRTPYLVPILNAFQDPDIETVVVCKSAQIAGTEMLITVMGYYAHQEPCSMMLVMADEDTAEHMSKKRIQPMFEAHDDLARLIVQNQFNKDEMTLSNGAYVAMGWASSVAKLASRPMRVVMLDEVDKPGYYITTKEASPIKLAIERTETFFRRKIGIISTPTTEEGNIWKQLHACDVIYDWHVPCPECGQFQPLRWSRKYSQEFKDGKYLGDDGELHPVGEVVWEGGLAASPEQIERAGYRCGECGKVWDTYAKARAVERGKMVSRTETSFKPRRVGFHINRLYSLLGKSGNIPKLVEDWITCQNDPRELQGFINSTLAEPWRIVVTSSNETDVLRARCGLQAGKVPEQAVALTCGVDVQKLGFWYVVRAHARDYTSWLVQYGFLPRWEDLEALLFQAEFKSEVRGDPFYIWRAAIDTGGGDVGVDDEENFLSRTEEVYFWLRSNGIGRGCRCFGTKGSSHPLGGYFKYSKPIDKTPSGKSLGTGLQLVMLDTSKLKDAFFFRLNNAITGGPHAAYLHSETGVDYVRQILAEEKRRDRRGVEEWVRVRKANHLLDAEVLAMACADPAWPGGGVNLLPDRPQPDFREPADRGSGKEYVPKRNDWFRGRR
ncbi:MAG: Phage terminase large subunit (GpA) [Syntrophaceae bacterium PtaU1.Bin231]|nr:MAG: Phage terminase large subunit (GpA) [Syntrophaceae bacterium PtaU1.Bin231]